MKKSHILEMLHCIVFTHYFCAMETTSRLCINNKPLVKEMVNNSSAFIVFEKDIQDNIIRKMFNISDKALINISIKNAIKYYLNIKQHCPLEVGNKIYAIEDLLFLNHYDRQKLIAIGNPSYSKTKLGFSHSLISKSDAQALDTMPDHIRKDLKVTVFESNFKTMVGKLDRQDAGVCATTCWLGSLGWIISLDGATFFERLVLIGTPILCGIGLGCCYGCMRYNPACHQCVDKIRKSRYSCKFEKQY